LDHKIYLFGGCSRSTDGVYNRDEALRFDPATQRWTTLHPLPTAARGITAVALGGHHILLAGGYTNATPGFSDASYVYDTTTDRYTPVSSLPLPVMGLAFVRHNNNLWALGGEDKAQHRSARFFEAALP
jgi:N-acetylneuraminic acid mutarotase